MADYIAEDVANINTIIVNGQSSMLALSATAQRGIALRDAIYNSPEYLYSKAWMDLFWAGYRDYKQSTVPHSSYITIQELELPYYGNRTDFFGQLHKRQILSAGSLSTPVSSRVFIAGWVPASEQLTFYASPTWTLSAGPSVNLIQGPTWTDGSTLSTVNVESIRFHVNRFSFLSQYLWADPTNLTHVRASSASTYFNVKFGVNFNAQSLLKTTSSLRVDTAFYENKKIYLSSL